MYLNFKSKNPVNLNRESLVKIIFSLQNCLSVGMVEFR